MMKAIYCSAWLMAVVLTACAAPQQQSVAQTAKTAQAAADGSSMERAVLIDENDTMRGIAAENRWIAQNLPQCRKRGQALLQGQGKVYDRITLECPDGRREVYFDIGRFFGRYDGKLLGE